MNNISVQEVKQRFQIIGNSPLLDHCIATALRVAETNLSVLIEGENGVGKENIAKIIQAYSPRKHSVMMSCNCGAIPSGTIDSELFGHVKGAFTNATTDRKGYFETANGGTLFLDEIGELDEKMQSKLLRVLETGDYYKVGSDTAHKTDVRIIAATNRDLEQEVQKGHFREDLYYRINTVKIKVPSLRERLEDIPLLFRLFAHEFCDSNHIPSLRLTPEAELLLKQYRWSGNIRQLRSVAQSISIMEQDREITEDILRPYLPSQERTSTEIVIRGAQNVTSTTGMIDMDLLQSTLLQMQNEINLLKQQLNGMVSQPFTEVHSNPPTPSTIASQRQIEDIDEGAGTLDEIMRNRIETALKHCNGNRKQAAIELDMCERTLYRKIKQYGL